MKTLIDFMREHPVCFRKPSARMARAAGTWAERVKLTVPESADADRPRAEYPRPQLVRDNFEILNGNALVSEVTCHLLSLKYAGGVDNTEGSAVTMNRTGTVGLFESAEVPALDYAGVALTLRGSANVYAVAFCENVSL